MSKPLCFPERDILIIGTSECLEHDDRVYSDVLVEKKGNDFNGLLCGYVHPQRNSDINISRKEILKSDGPIQDLCWIVPGESVASISGTGLLNFYSISSSNKDDLQLKHVYHEKVSEDSIRQLVVDDYCSRLAYGGYDRRLTIRELKDGRESLSSKSSIGYMVNGNLGSISWHPTEPVHISYTLDEGMWVLADLRDRHPESCLNTKRLHFDVTGDIFGTVSCSCY